VDTDLPVISGGLASVLQPTDVSVNKPFKDNVRKLHMQSTAEGGHELTPTRNIRRPLIEIMCNWIVEAWNMVSMKINMKSFLKTGITNALDRSEGDILWAEDKNVDAEGEGETEPESNYYSSELRSAGNAGQDRVREGEVGLTFVRGNRSSNLARLQVWKAYFNSEVGIYDQETWYLNLLLMHV
jgi:hypothetical protein